MAAADTSLQQVCNIVLCMNKERRTIVLTIAWKPCAYAVAIFVTFMRYPSHPTKLPSH